MTQPVFKSFNDIKRFTNITFSITQKIHGSNACILVWPNDEKGGELDLLVGSRTRWIYPGQDNYGFAGFVHAHREEFIKLLGIGKHDGEWAGPGINSGEGLKEKTFCLFDWWKWPAERVRPPQTTVVPLLYRGSFGPTTIDDVMKDLKENGSKLVPGFMRPEGVVINLNGTLYKKVFDAEETAWTKGSSVKNPNPKVTIDYNYLCQPIRLEKLLSRDEDYVTDYPKTLGSIVRDYIADLVKEGQIAGSEDEVKAIAKDATGQVFRFVKTTMNERGQHD